MLKKAAGINKGSDKPLQKKVGKVTRAQVEEITAIAKAKMVELGVSTKAEAGKFTGALMKELKGKADGGDVKAVVDSLLS